MNSINLRVMWILAVATVLLTVQGLTQIQSSVAQDRPVLRLGVNAADLSTLDPHFVSDRQDRAAIDMIFNGLLRFKPGDSRGIEPDIATQVPEPVMQGDTQVWTFTLRDDVMCHSWEGGESYLLTADDVVASLQKSANPDTSAYAGDYEGWTVSKVDDFTITIALDKPLSPALFLPRVANYQGGFIVCSKAYEALGAEAFATSPVGTGPFALSSYTAQSRLELVANDDFFRGAPLLDGVELHYIPDIASREAALISGELDVIDGIAEADWVESINSADGAVAEMFGPGEVAFINLNVEHEILSDRLVRQAIAHAINLEDHQTLYGSPVAEIVYSVVPEMFMPGGLTRDEAEDAGVLMAYDPDRARALLEEAGYPDGFTISVVTSEMPAYRFNYELLQSDLEAIGIDLQLEVVDHASMHAQIREDVSPIVIYLGFRPNADVFLTQFFHSDSIVVTGESPLTNFSHYAGIDDLIEQARAETDPDAQEQLWKEANIRIQSDIAAIPLHFQQQVYARNPNVDYGHELVSVLALYPGFDEATSISG